MHGLPRFAGLALSHTLRLSGVVPSAPERFIERWIKMKIKFITLFITLIFFGCSTIPNHQTFKSDVENEDLYKTATEEMKALNEIKIIRILSSHYEETNERKIITIFYVNDLNEIKCKKIIIPNSHY